MKIAFTTLGCPEWDIDTIIARAKEYGYDGVDFRGLQGEMDVYKLPEFSDKAEQTKKKFDDAGLAVSGFSSGAYMFTAAKEDRKASVEEVARYAELCRIFGTKYIRVFGGQLKGTPLEEAIEISLEVLEEMAAVAAPATVAVETHDDWVSTAPLRKVFERVKAENLGVLWDLNHPHRYMGETPQESYDNIGRYTVYTHVKDSRLDDSKAGQPVLPGEGSVPLAEMVNLLRAGGYDGYLTLEWEKKWHPEIAEPEVAFPPYARYLRELIGG